MSRFARSLRPRSARSLCMLIAGLTSACSTPSTKPSQEISPLVRASCPPPAAMTGQTFADFIQKTAEQGIQYRKCRAAIGLD